jgi:site-specific recombinase XerD
VFSVSKGVSLRAIQKYLGHSTVQTTEIYAAAAPDFLQNESEKISKGFDAAA